MAAYCDVILRACGMLQEGVEDINEEINNLLNLTDDVESSLLLYLLLENSKLKDRLELLEEKLK